MGWSLPQDTPVVPDAVEDNPPPYGQCGGYIYPAVMGFGERNP